MSNSATPGWYHAQGDPAGTERFWDGASWTEGPRPVGGVPDMPSAQPPTAGMETPGGFSTETPGATTSGMETPGMETPGGFSTETPGTRAPGGFSTETPSMPSSGGPQDGFGAPPVPFGATAGTTPGGFPGAPAGVPGATGFYPEESKATTAIVVAVVGALLCGPVAIIGGVMGNSERKAIAEGRRDPAGQGKATVALVIGAIMAILTILVIFAVIAIAIFA